MNSPSVIAVRTASVTRLTVAIASGLMSGRTSLKLVEFTFSADVVDECVVTLTTRVATALADGDDDS